MNDPLSSRRIDDTAPFIDGWDRAQLNNSAEWRISYPDDAVAEVRSHLARNDGISQTLYAAEFRALADVARQVRHEIAYRYGLMWLRPDPSSVTSELTDMENRALFSILTSLMGMAHREVIIEEVDGRDHAEEFDPGGLATAMLDELVPDALGVLRLSRMRSDERLDAPARKGHEICVVSSHAVHRELETQDAAILRSLYLPVSQTKDSSAPIFHYERASRALEFRYDRQRIITAHNETAQPMPTSVVHALDVLDKAMNLPHLVASVRLDRGDVLFVNNKSVATLGLLRPSADDVVQHVRIMRDVKPVPGRSESAVD